MDLGTTNTWLAIIAIASALQVLMFIGIGVGGYLMYSRVMQLVNELETRQIAPLREKVDGILLDVKAVTSRVNLQTERVSHAVSGTMDKVDHTAHAVGDTVRDKVNRMAGMVRGARAAIASVLSSDSRNEPAYRNPAVGRAS